MVVKRLNSTIFVHCSSNKAIPKYVSEQNKINNKHRFLTCTTWIKDFFAYVNS